MTLGELLMAATITLSVMGALVGVTRGAQETFQTLPEAADMEQRLRVAVDALSRDLIMAGAGRTHGSADPCSDDVSVWPLESEAIEIAYVPRSETISATRTYYLATDPSTNVSGLMRDDDGASTLPVADHLVRIRFEYFDQGAARLDPAEFEDGPWCTAGVEEPFDADLTRIRRIRVVLRVEPALESMRGRVAEREVAFEISPRNLNVD